MKKSILVCIILTVVLTLSSHRAIAFPDTCTDFPLEYEKAKHEALEIIKFYSFNTSTSKISDKDTRKLQDLTAKNFLYDRPLLLYEKKELNNLYNFIRPCFKSFKAEKIINEINKINTNLKNTFVYLKTTSLLNETYKENKEKIENEIKSDILKSPLLQSLNLKASDFYDLKFVADLCNFNDFLLFIEKSYNLNRIEFKTSDKYFEINHDDKIALKLMKIDNKMSLGFFNNYEQIFKDGINPDIFACDLSYRLRLIYAGKFIN